MVAPGPAGGVGDAPIGGIEGDGLMLLGIDGVGTGEVEIGGRLGEGKTGGVRTGMLGEGTVSEGSGIGDGRPTRVAT